MVRSVGKEMMKRFLVVFIILFSVHLHAHKHEDFLQANKAYSQGDYDKALQIYVSLEDKGVGVYFNMGNAYYKKGDYAQALMSWKKAQRLAYGAQLRAIFENIKKAEKKLALFTDSLTDTVIISVGPYVSYIPMVIMQLVWLLFVCGIVFSFLRQAGHRRVFTLFLFVIGLVFVGGVMAIKRTIQLNNCALVMNKEALLFAGPNNRYHQVTSVVRGNQLFINAISCQQENDWYKVMFGNHVGWVSSSALSVI